VLSSQDNYKPLTKISPFVLEKWIKCVAGAVTNVTKTKSGDLLIECYRKTQSINLQTANKILDTEILATPPKLLALKAPSWVWDVQINFHSKRSDIKFLWN
jgi:hypothetical protein